MFLFFGEKSFDGFPATDGDISDSVFYFCASALFRGTMPPANQYIYSNGHGLFLLNPSGWKIIEQKADVIRRLIQGEFDKVAPGGNLSRSYLEIEREFAQLLRPLTEQSLIYNVGAFFYNACDCVEWERWPHPRVSFRQETSLADLCKWYVQLGREPAERGASDERMHYSLAYRLGHLGGDPYHIFRSLVLSADGREPLGLPMAEFNKDQVQAVLCVFTIITAYLVASVVGAETVAEHVSGCIHRLWPTVWSLLATGMSDYIEAARFLEAFQPSIAK